MYVLLCPLNIIILNNYYVIPAETFHEFRSFMGAYISNEQKLTADDDCSQNCGFKWATQRWCREDHRIKCPPNSCAGIVMDCKYLGNINACEEVRTFLLTFNNNFNFTKSH